MLQALIHLIQLLKRLNYLEADAGKLDINKLTNVSTSLNNLKTKVDDIDVVKLKAVSVDLKKLSYVVDNEVVENTTFNTLKITVNNLERKFVMQLL